MPAELTVVESTVELTAAGETTVELEITAASVVLESASAPGPQGPPGAGGVIDADYLVGTGHAGLSAEIVVGTSPGGELGGTWASPTVDASHSGSTHAAVQAAAEATAAGALATHTADTTAVHGIADTSALVVDGDAAGGVLGGTYPNPSFAADMATQAELDAHVNDATAAHAATAIAFTPDGSIAATTVQAAIVEVRDEAGGGGAPTTVDYLVGTADGGLSNEIVVGTSPGGELGGTWASPTVDASHSGSTHAAVQAAAEATAAGALTTHTADTTAVHGIADTSALALTANHPSNATFNDHSARHEFGGADELDIDVTMIAPPGEEGDVIKTQGGVPVWGTLTPAAGSVLVDSTNLSGTGPNAQTVFEELDNLLDDHSARHEDGGADEISLTGLSGTPAALTTHEADTTSIHGIADTSALALTANHPSNATFNDHSARHENGGADEISLAGLDGTPVELTNHLNDTADAHDASAVSVVSTTLSGTGTDVQAVFEELDNLLDDHSARHENGGADEISIAGLDGTPTELTNHLNDATAAHAATAISADSTTLVGTGTTVQEVFEELDNAIAALGSSAMTLIASSVLGSAGTFDFNSIPGTYNHLLLFFILRTTANNAATANMTINADSGNNYHRVSLSDLNTTVAGAVGTIPTSSALLSANAMVGTTDTAGRASHLRVWLPGYKGTTFHKDWLSEAHSSVSAVAGGQGLSIATGTWGSTAAITRIQLAPSAGSTFVTGSAGYLYGIL